MAKNNGFPGTIASMWQQAGRAGRGEGASLAVLVAGTDQLDQWLMTHPREVFRRAPEPQYDDEGDDGHGRDGARTAALEGLGHRVRKVCHDAREDDERDAVADLVDTLLRNCSGLTVLATSREPLGIDGERVLPVQPLPVPPTTPGSAPTVAAMPSVALFCQRATAAS